jgi:hypothetical protein
MDTGPEHADMAAGRESLRWWPLNGLLCLGRAASIAAGDTSQEHDEFHCFRIAVTGHSGAYYARVTHYLGKAIRLPAALSDQLGARFPSADEAVQHARFMITSGAFKPVQRG